MKKWRPRQRWVTCCNYITSEWQTQIENQTLFPSLENVLAYNPARLSVDSERTLEVRETGLQSPALLLPGCTTLRRHRGSPRFLCLVCKMGALSPSQHSMWTRRQWAQERGPHLMPDRCLLAPHPSLVPSTSVTLHCGGMENQTRF